MNDLNMKELFERFKNEVLTDIESEEEKDAITSAFIVAFTKN